MDTKVDVLIVGLGVAGFSAAVSAVEKGKRVLVVEREGTPGGNAIQSNVGTICGAYYRSDEVSIPVKHEFLEHVVKSVGDKPMQYHKGLVVVPYNLEILNEFIVNTLNELHVQVRYNTSIEKVEIQNGAISRVLASGADWLKPNAVIDCSGSAIVSQLAGIETIKSESYQSASQVFRVENVELTNEYALNLSLKRASTLLVRDKKWPNEFLTLSLVPGSLRSGMVDLKFSLPERITDSVDIKLLNSKGKEYALQLFEGVKHRVDSLRSAKITMIFPHVGIRVQQRSKGKHVLTEDEVLNCVKHKDEIAMGTWPIEEWNDNGNILMQYFQKEDYYSIPTGCLESCEVSNLFFAGKNISATDKAIASARVIGTCIQTGYAAGKLTL